MTFTYQHLKTELRKQYNAHEIQSKRKINNYNSKGEDIIHEKNYDHWPLHIEILALRQPYDHEECHCISQKFATIQ